MSVFLYFLSAQFIFVTILCSELKSKTIRMAINKISLIKSKIESAARVGYGINLLKGRILDKLRLETNFT